MDGTFPENTLSLDPIGYILSLMRMYLIGSNIRQPKVASGGVLLQLSEKDEKWDPIAFLSKSLTSMQQN